MKNRIAFFILISIVLTSLYAFINEDQEVIVENYPSPVSPSKPSVLWWWFAGEIKKADVKDQLDWLKENNIGGVMIFFLYPQGKIANDTNCKRYEFLGKEFTEIVTYTKLYCDTIGMQCNFLFGTGWPFGGSFITQEDATYTWTKDGLSPMQTFSVSWEWPKKGYVVDHLNKTALDKYFEKIRTALLPALKGNKSYLECDSWEIGESEPLWTRGFDSLFLKNYGYDITPYLSTYAPAKSNDPIFLKQTPTLSKLYNQEDPSLNDIRYDYYKLLSDMILMNFYHHYTHKCNAIGSGSIVECCGTPADNIDAFASVDIPMTEAMLYEPNYSKIPSSAVCLSGKKILTAEAFTCAYGFRNKYENQEQIADMKLIADALFVNGVNHIYWHGFPLNPMGVDTVKYYATVNVSKRSKLMNGFKPFNKYMEKVSGVMQKGDPKTEIAVYLPTEDRLAEGIYSQDFFKTLSREEHYWHFSKYQMRYEYFPDELVGHPMHWINGTFIKNGDFKNNQLITGKTSFKALYINSEYLPYETLSALVKLAKKGLPICLKRDVKEPGVYKHKYYLQKLQELKSYKNVSSNFDKIYHTKPLIEGTLIPEFYSRIDGKDTYIFFANPLSKSLEYPIKYGQSLQKNSIISPITINLNDTKIPLKLVFKPYQSILLKIDKESKITFIDIEFIPDQPQVAVN